MVPGSFAEAEEGFGEKLESFFGDLFSGLETGWEEEELPAEEADAGASLWGKRVAVYTEAVPDRAYVGGNEFCFAMAPDGEQVVISGGEAPYLWGLETGKHTPLWLGDEKTRDTVAETVGKIAIANPQLLKKDPESMSDPELLAAYLKYALGDRGGGRCMRLMPVTGQTDGNDLILADNYGCWWLLDCGTGALYTYGNGYLACSSFGDRMLFRQMTPGAGIVTVDRSSGKEQTKDFTSVPGYAAGATMTGAAYLPDGSLCAVLRDRELDKDHGENCCLAVYGPDGQTELYPLGRIRLSQEPDVIMSADGNWIVAYSRAAMSIRCPYLIHRETGEVFLIVTREGGPEMIPLKDCLNPETGEVVRPEGGLMLFLMAGADRETLFVYDMEVCQVSLFHPEKCALQWLSMDPEGVPIPQYFSGSGADRMMLVFMMDPAPVVVRLEAK